MQNNSYPPPGSNSPGKTSARTPGNRDANTVSINIIGLITALLAILKRLLPDKKEKDNAK